MRNVRNWYTALLLISLFATLWSLYVEYYWDPVRNIIEGVLFSSDRGIAACTLCRYIRMCMYPLIPISALALIKKQRNAYIFIQPLLIFGFIFSARKRSVQHFALPTPSICSPQVPCTLTDVNYFGFISLSLLGMAWFALMFVITIYITKRLNKHAIMQRIADLL